MSINATGKARTSNRDADWAKLYGFYEVQMRDVYRQVSKPQNDSHFELLKNLAFKYISRGSIFCEIGFSAGITLRLAAGLFPEVYGLDISPENVEFTKRELEKESLGNIQLFHSDLMERDERFHNKFDVASLIHGLEHFSADDYPIILENIRYYLKEGGIFTGALPYKGRFNYRMCPNCFHVFEIDGHVSIHDRQTLASLFRDHDFEILYLGNFNRYYNRTRRSFVRRTYKYVNHILLKKESNDQLEFIVKPNSRTKR
jgi:SAM-dependent methyltransferase